MLKMRYKFFNIFQCVNSSILCIIYLFFIIFSSVSKRSIRPNLRFRLGSNGRRPMLLVAMNTVVIATVTIDADAQAILTVNGIAE